MADASHFYADFFKTIDQALISFISQTAADIVVQFRPMVTSFLIIYTMIWGFNLLTGSIKTPLSEGMIRIVRISIIVSLALGIGVYNSYIVDTFWNIPDALGQIVGKGSVNTPAAAFDFLDKTFDKFYETFQHFYDTGVNDGLSGIGMILFSFLIFAAGIGVTVGAFILLATVKVLLASCLGVGPIFIAMTMFDATKKYTESWLSLITTCIALQLLVIVFIKLVLTIIDTYIAKMGNAVEIKTAGPLILFSIVCIIYYLQIPSFAMTLGGGAVVSSMGVGRLIGGAIVKGTQSAAKSSYNVASGMSGTERTERRRRRKEARQWATDNPSMATRIGKDIINEVRGKNSVKKAA